MTYLQAILTLRNNILSYTFLQKIKEEWVYFLHDTRACVHES